MQRLLDIKSTQIQLVRDRGFNVPEDEVPIEDGDMESFVSFIEGQVEKRELKNPGIAAVRGLLSRVYTNDAKDAILVYYASKVKQQNKQISAETVRAFIQTIGKYNKVKGKFSAILIVDAPLSSTGNAELSALTTVNWQVYQDSELVYNPTRRVDVPPHELVPPPQVDAKLRELKVDISKLLIIRAEDPVVKYYGWKSGSLVKITRDDSLVSILTPISINYRIVVG